MSSSNRIGRWIWSLPEVRAAFAIAGLCALQGCSMWQQGHGPKPAVADALAVTESQPAAPADPATTGATIMATAPPPAAANDAAPGPATVAIEPRQAAPVSRSARQPLTGGSRDALSSEDVGYYMDVLQGQLTRAIGRDARIERRGSSIMLLLPLGFEVDSTQLNFTARRTVRRLAEILSEYRLTIVAVQVSGPDSKSQSSRLATDRVAALSRYLSHAGVAGKRISPAGEGSSLSPQDSASASLVGVRAELQVSPIVVGAGN